MRGFWIVLAGLSCFATPALSGEPLTVRFANTAQPDAELQTFVATLVQLDAPSARFDRSRAEAMFAPKVKMFDRSLDPFLPWKRRDDARKDFLQAAADVMVEQGGVEGVQPDYRPEALKTIVEQVTRGQPFGIMQQVPGAICAPAEYRVNRKAALKAAQKYQLDAYSLRFFATAMPLYSKPNGKGTVVGSVPPYTLMMFDYEDGMQQPWSRYEISGGQKGYLHEDQPALGLAQHHVCFGKVKGQYRIVALFGYTL